MGIETIKIPDLGGGDGVEVIEVCVAVGDTVAAEDSLLVLESDKASMEVPAPMAGVVKAISLKVGDTVNEGDVILELEVKAEIEGASASAPVSEKAAPEPVAPQNTPEPAAAPAPEKTAVVSAEQEVVVPDIGTGDQVELIELCVAVGDELEEGDSLVVLESDKASMEVPAPFAGTVSAIAVKLGDKVGQGTLLLKMKTAAELSPTEPSTTVEASSAPVAEAPVSTPTSTPVSAPAPVQETASEPTVVSQAGVYAGPAVRKLAREFGIPLEKVAGTGPRNRIVKEDLHAFVKTLTAKGPQSASAGSGIPAVPEVDFSQFGEIDIQPLTKLHKLTAANMHRSWLNVPHVTQYDDADITELEDFRKGLKAEAEKRGVKMTPLPFLLKAAASALLSNPKFNASMSADGENMVFKKYVHIGIAVDTPAGLVVPVLRDVDKKSLWELAAESAELAQKAKDRKLKPADMQGGCFTISSLGNIGGTGFTPIINTPEVAILGVSKLAVKPVWDGANFVPRQMLPLSLSYDHRAINGADAGKFFTEMGAVLADIRRLLL
ncbi:dihydrolipoyllysine-residue acetyltransferase [Spongiibacter sp. KMU-158]|uniref:Acetyltransferase component of pyruvate dehydrogenase complex n=1 Tax=Spongiibacter pelagi TaxID=2760804 RepID=A0A927C2Z8_9GAMM|nr:dihydrolipoyllysine-residue acetyltransferase [Spongiibacter pelagi]MBD2859839.1 dihydrolipoyllysine-residue acetyltransferase [Spongiibacter pelagi]